MYQRTQSSMMSASNTRLRYIRSRTIGFVIQHLGRTKSGSLSDVPGCTRTNIVACTPTLNINKGLRPSVGNRQRHYWVDLLAEMHSKRYNAFIECVLTRWCYGNADSTQSAR